MTTPDQPTGAFPPPPHQPGPYPPPAQPYPPRQYAPMPGGPPPGYYLPPPPLRKKSWLGSTAGILTIVFGTIGLMIVLCGGLITIGRVSDSKALSKMDVQVTGCEVTGSVAKVSYSVTNNGDRARRVRLDIEYRDSGGARLDTDTAYVGEVPAGDTVRGEESTILNAQTTSGTCKIVRVH